MENKREYIYDYIRIIACIFIIAIHANPYFFQPHMTSEAALLEYRFVTAFVRTGLPLFVFISGALILNKKEEKTSDFYLKRFKKIIIPFLVYSYIFIWINKYQYSLELFRPGNFFKGFIEILKGPANYHIWFMYVMIGLYVFVPYLRKMLQNLNEKECKNLIVLLYIISLIKHFLPIFKINTGISNLLIVEWNIPFILAYLIKKDFIINKYYKLIYVLGVLSFIFLGFATFYIYDNDNIYKTVPTMLMQTQAVFVFFIRNKDKICKKVKINKIMEWLSKYSYEIYLIHPKILEILYSNIFSKTKGIEPISYSIVGCLVIFLVSLLCAYIIHNLIVINLVRLFDFIIKNIRKLAKVRFHRVIL